MRLLKKKSRDWLCAVAIATALGLFFLAKGEQASAQGAPDWKQRWEKVLSEARREGKVVVLGPPGELIREAMSRGFSKAFPDITIEYSGSRSAEQATKLTRRRGRRAPTRPFNKAPKSGSRTMVLR